MPFWWNRRRKPWYGPWRQRRYRKRIYKRRPRRRRNRQTFRRRRRRRRRRYKVRRKAKKITVKQWQPDSITKCHIKGVSTLVAGTQGSQYRCYTDNRNEFTIPKAPGGGLIGYETYTLQYLYNEWKARRNIWTKSNDYKDLVRYLGCTIYFTRHQTTDFLVMYDRQPPFNVNKDTFIDLHPQNMLLARHKKAIPSWKTKPYGKPRVKIHIRPPKLMQTKWYFQETFSTAQLFALAGTACNFSYGIYGPNTQSQCITLKSLNTAFYQSHNWSNASAKYLPYSTYPTKGYTFTGPKGQVTIVNDSNLTYAKSVNRDTGFFQPKVLTATRVQDSAQQKIANTPITVCRYNPEVDTGVNNIIWLVDTFSLSGWTTHSPAEFEIVGVPLYMACLGILDWIKRSTKDKSILTHTLLVVKSPAIELLTPHEQTVFPFIDDSFINGNLPYGEYITQQHINNWYPTVEKQLETLNAFVTCGSYVPKYDNQPSSTWQLTYKYNFSFKWGGPRISDYSPQNPATQGVYPIPDKLFKTIQVANPLKQAYKAMFRSWDTRRGILTKSAIKRMSENLQIDSTFSSDDSEPEKKKKRHTNQVPTYNQAQEEIESCLNSLFQEETPPQTENLQLLIQHQQEQQHKLKFNIIRLLIDLKKKQRTLQMQTGVL
nr:MAG: ORF1 [Torque teno midi virus]